MKKSGCAAPEKGKVWPHIYTMLLVIVGWALFVAATKAFRSGCCFKSCSCPRAVFHRCTSCALRRSARVGILCATPLPQKLYEKFKTNTLMRGLVLALIFVVTIAYMVDATNSPFLYFRF
ncbi:MAG: hypothetical protein ACLRZH_12750 [Ruthenibacterium lactatiformans]